MLSSKQFLREMESRFNVLFFQENREMGVVAFVRNPLANIYFHVGLADGVFWKSSAISAPKQVSSLEEFDGVNRLSEAEIREELRKRYGSIISKTAIIEADPEE